MNYYGAFHRSALYPLLTRINSYLVRWLRKKHPRLRGWKKAQDAGLSHERLCRTFGGGRRSFAVTVS
jgi:hypothetical protein